jgi:PadR family transcriptional regulator PadR
MPSEAIEVLKGSLDMMVLKILDEEPTHGYGITRRLQELTDDALQVDEGSMYPALYRMQKRGLIEAEWFLTDSNRRAKIYSLTRDGRDQLKREAAYWERFSEAVNRVMTPATEAAK